MLSTCICGLIVVFSTTFCSVEAQSDQSEGLKWYDGDGGIKWFQNCDFVGYDIGRVLLTATTGKQCLNLCIANPECTHFAFGSEDYCYMKNAPLTYLRQEPIPYSTICGFVPWRLDSHNVTDDWNVTRNEIDCQFYGNNSLIFTTPCRKTEDCGAWYNVVNKTSGTTSCKLIDGSEGSCCPDLPSPKFLKNQSLQMTPNINERILDADSTLTITCTYAFEDEYQKENFGISWEIPDYLFQNAEQMELDRRLNKTFNKNETHMTSTMTLTNTKTRDTGLFGCKGLPYGYRQTSITEQYVYVFDGTELVIAAKNEYYIYIPQGHIDYVILCRPTHPDVKVSWIFKHQYTVQGETGMEDKNLLEDPNSNWSFDPQIGLKLKKAKIDDSGYYECAGTLNEKRHSNDFYMTIHGMELTKVDGVDETMVGNNVTLICRNYYGTGVSIQPTWAYRNNINESIQMINETNPPKGIQIKTNHFDHSDERLSESRLSLTVVEPNDYTFQCQANEMRSISFRIGNIEPIGNDQPFTAVRLTRGIAHNLTCFKASINENFQWFKDGILFSGALQSDDYSSVLLLQGKIEEAGIYNCRQTNRLIARTAEKIFIVSSDNSKNVTVIAVSLAVLVLSLIGIAAGVVFYTFNKKRKAVLQRLLDGSAEQIDDQSPMEEQVEFLPYDKRWEFPRHRLKLGIQLGMGCFGRILKAEAVGIKDSDEVVKTVAVKMVRSETNIGAMESLIGELKILAYLGSHLNVVNLLGACTKQMHRGDLLIIIEYCRFGNLQSYLIKRRNFFVNQVDQFGNLLVEDAVDDENIIRNQCSIEMENAQMDSDSKYVPMDPFGINSSLEMLTESAHSNISREPNSAINESSIEPESPKSLWHYQHDPSTVADGSFSTRDLISWSFQIARGMDYLVSKKVLHGDLAARNVLLADNKIAKVADFGMSRKTYYEDMYEKKGQGPMPIKWMAIESLIDRIFSSQSDVWSYGVVLWELFSIGKTPYPGMDAAHVIVKEIAKGYRMDKPDFAPCFIADIMTSCWKDEPKARPTFREMEELICRHMESDVSSSYLNMNEPYVKLNEEKVNASPNDLFGLAKLLQEKTRSKSTENSKRYSTFPVRFHSSEENDQQVCYKETSLFEN